MSETKKTTKLIAVAASLAMVASAGYAVAASDMSARAEEPALTTEHAEDTFDCSFCNTTHAANECSISEWQLDDTYPYEVQWTLCPGGFPVDASYRYTCNGCGQHYIDTKTEPRPVLHAGTNPEVYCPDCFNEIFGQNYCFACDTKFNSREELNLKYGDDDPANGVISASCPKCGAVIWSVDGGELPDPDPDPSTPVSSGELRDNPVLTIDNTEPAVGGEVVVSMRQTDAPKDGAHDSFESFKMIMSSPNTDLNVKEVRVKEGANLIYSSTRADKSFNRGNHTRDANGNYVFSFYDEYLQGNTKPVEDGVVQGGMGYSGTSYTMELVLEVPSNMAVLSKHEDAASGNAVFALDNMTAWSETKRPAGSVVSTQKATNASNLTVRMPRLSAVMTTGKPDAQVYDTMTYNVVITNTGAGSATGVKIVDSQIDPYAALGITPVSATLTKNGIAISLPDGALVMNNGNIEINLPDSVQISPSDRVVLTYTVTAGLDSMRTDKGKLQELLALDAGNRSGERKVVVSASNAFAAATAETAFNLLIPAASATATTSKSEITTGERSQVTTTFRVEGEETSTLIAPKISISDPTAGHIENIKVNGTPYNRGDALRDVPQGSSLILTYDIVAPEDYKPSYNDGISVSSVLSADNLVNNLTSTSKVAVAIPEMGVGLSLSDATPSSEDSTDDTHPVHVTATFGERSGKAKATGVQLVVFDAAAKAGEDPVSERFANVRVNGAEPVPGTYTIDPNSGTMTINVAEIAPNGEVKVEYDDYLKGGYEPNGWMDSISTRIQKHVAQGVASNFPAGQEKSAVADFTVQTPEMHIAQEVTEPVTEKTEGEGDEAATTVEPDIINVGDTVKFKTTFFENSEDMPAAKGRDFKMTTKIEDLFISNKKDSDKETNDKAAREMSDERDAATQESDEKLDGRTYKPSQLGITFCPVDEIKLMAGDTDVTDKYDVEMNSSRSEMTITPKADAPQDMPEVPTSMEFSVKMGKYEDENNYDQLAGKEINVRSEVAVSNLSRTASAVSKTQIADAELYLTKSAVEKEIAHGMTDTYTITAVNDKDDKFADNSVARNIVIEDDLDQAAADYGYKIDPSTLKIMMGDEDITSTSEVVVLWETGNTGFDVKLSRDLDKEETLTITYDATTTEIAADAYSQTLGNVVIATADNAKPAVAFENINYAGIDMPVDGPGTGDSLNGENGGNIDGTLGGTGDVVPYVIGGVMAVALIGGVVVLVVRRRNR